MGQLGHHLHATLLLAAAAAMAAAAAGTDSLLAVSLYNSLTWVRNGSQWTPPQGQGAYGGPTKALDGASSFLLMYPGTSSNLWRLDWETGAMINSFVTASVMKGFFPVLVVDEPRGLAVWGTDSGLYRCNMSACTTTTAYLGTLTGGVSTEMKWYGVNKVTIRLGRNLVLRDIWTGEQSSLTGGYPCSPTHGPIQAPDGHLYYSCGPTIYRDAEAFLSVEGTIDYLEYDARDNRVYWACNKKWIRATTKGPGSAVGISIPQTTEVMIAPRVPKELLTMPCPAGSERAARGCQKCRYGTTDDDLSSATPCSDCPAGSYSNQTGSAGSCKKCPAGKYLASSWGPCLTCPKGTYAPTAGWPGSCLVCPAGRFLASSSGPCAACPAGTSDADSDSTTACQPCAAGTYTATANVSGPCTTCAPGNYLSSSSGPCTQCALGSTDHDSNPSTQCAKCDQGLTTPVGRTGACLLCNAGHFLQGPQGPCEVCQPGFRDTDSSPATPNASTPCVLCSAGSHTAEGHSGACDQCPAGTSDNDSDPLTECTACATGTYSPAPGRAELL
eukprot:m51a1_g910 putative protein serine threonine (556) ;mRNA; f:117699-120542